jgi:hypothetical protein
VARVYERRKAKLVPRRIFIKRIVQHLALATVLLLASLALGVAGYMCLEGMDFADAVLNAAMILGGMGPVNELHTVSAKYFASFYALFSGIVFLVVVGIILAPVAHRVLHQFHMDDVD